MKRLLALALVIVVLISLCGCGGGASTKNLGETSSTDIVELTINDAQFAYYLSSVRNVGKPTKTYITPYKTESERGNDTFFAAPTGHAYVWLSFDIKNTDRGNSLSFGGSFNDWEWAIKYNGKEYAMKGYDLSDADGSGGINMAHAAVNNYGNDASNILLYAGEGASIRAFGVVGIDPSSLDDGFELIIRLPNSSGKYEKFVYTVG